MGLPMSAESWRRMYLGSAIDVDMDSSGRLNMPPELRSWAQIDREAHLVGMGTRMELWNRQRLADAEQKTLEEAMPDVLQATVL